jgi:VWFA-related protein
MKNWVLGLVFVLAGAGASASLVEAEEAGPPAGDLIRVVVTVTGLHRAAPPALTREDVLVYQDRQRRPVVDWVPAQGEKAGLDLAILVDDSLDSELGLQFPDLAAFMRSLPPTTGVAVAYAAHGSANFLQDFTSDHELAAKAMRLPVGPTTGGGSIYQSVSELLKHWPKNEDRHEVLLISDGIDLFRGITESLPTLNTDLQQAIDDAHRHGVTVYTLFASGAGQFGSNFFLVNNGQGCLARLAYETGGVAFWQGSQTPLAFSPYLQQLTKLLGQQYLLTFRAKPGKQAGYERLRVTTEQPGVELAAPDHIYVPAAK